MEMEDSEPPRHSRRDGLATSFSEAPDGDGPGSTIPPSAASQLLAGSSAGSERGTEERREESSEERAQQEGAAQLCFLGFAAEEELSGSWGSASPADSLGGGPPSAPPSAPPSGGEAGAEDWRPNDEPLLVAARSTTTPFELPEDFARLELSHEQPSWCTCEPPVPPSELPHAQMPAFAHQRAAATAAAAGHVTYTLPGLEGAHAVAGDWPEQAAAQCSTQPAGLGPAPWMATGGGRNQPPAGSASGLPAAPQDDWRIPASPAAPPPRTSLYPPVYAGPLREPPSRPQQRPCLSPAGQPGRPLALHMLHPWMQRSAMEPLVVPREPLWSDEGLEVVASARAQGTDGPEVQAARARRFAATAGMRASAPSVGAPDHSPVRTLLREARGQWLPPRRSAEDEAVAVHAPAAPGKTKLQAGRRPCEPTAQRSSPSAGQAGKRWWQQRPQAATGACEREQPHIADTNFSPLGAGAHGWAAERQERSL